MNQEPKTPAAFPEARAKKLSAKKTIWLLAFFGLMVIMIGSGLAAGIIGHLDVRAGGAFGDNLPWVVMVSCYVAMIPVLWWSVRYWQSIDEMARRAHLDALYWGGCIGIALFLPFIAPMMAFPEFKMALVENLAITSTHAFGLGAAAMYGAIMIGYTLYWLFWWAKKR
jgi:hypothetical protein